MGFADCTGCSRHHKRPVNTKCEYLKSAVEKCLELGVSSADYMMYLPDLLAEDIPPEAGKGVKPKPVVDIDSTLLQQLVSESEASRKLLQSSQSQVERMMAQLLDLNLEERRSRSPGIPMAGTPSGVASGASFLPIPDGTESIRNEYLIAQALPVTTTSNLSSQVTLGSPLSGNSVPIYTMSGLNSVINPQLPYMGSGSTAAQIQGSQALGSTPAFSQVLGSIPGSTPVHHHLLGTTAVPLPFIGDGSSTPLVYRDGGSTPLVYRDGGSTPLIGREGGSRFTERRGNSVDRSGGDCSLAGS